MVAARVQVGHSQVSQQIVNTKGRWKHAHQTRHPTLEDPLDPGNMRRRQESSNNVLIQTNKKPKDFGDRETMGSALVTIVRMLATDPSIWSTFMVFGPIHKEYARDAEFPAQVIESILINHGSNQLTPETGDKQHRLHLHFLFTIQHYRVQRNPHRFQTGAFPSGRDVQQGDAQSRQRGSCIQAWDEANDHLLPDPGDGCTEVPDTLQHERAATERRQSPQPRAHQAAEKCHV